MFSINSLWNSPTLMTWLSYSTRFLVLFGVLPLVLKKFSAEDVILWYLFSTIIALQGVADFGFRQTFSRLISYAHEGAQEIGVRFSFASAGSPSQNMEFQPNLGMLSRITSTMCYIYLRLTAIVFILMSTLGTFSMVKPVEDSTKPVEGWISWGVVVVISCISFYGKLYMNFLEGLNKIAVVRRVESATSLGSIVSSLIILTFYPSLLNLILINQFWALIACFRDYYLCINVNNKIFDSLSLNLPFDRTTFLKIWSPAWRSGVSGFMSAGLTNLTGLIYAQVGQTGEVAAYLLALRIINQIRDVSMAPFYSKLPLLSMLRVKNNIDELVSIVKRGMLLSHLVFLAGFISVGVFADKLLRLLESETQFVQPELWFLLGIAFFIHRFGAMHIQVYISTNHVISHIADGISGLVYVLSAFLLSKNLGIYAVPVGMIIGYLGFYAWYSARFSYSSMNVKFLSFEKNVALPPAIILIAYILIIGLLHKIN